MCYFSATSACLHHGLPRQATDVPVHGGFGFTPSSTGPYHGFTIVQLLDSMGDLLAPKRRDVFDRLRRRIERYRRHNNTNLGRFQASLNGLYDQQRLDTLALHQRWLESKAKRPTKKNQGGQNKDSTQNPQANHSLAVG